MYDTVLVPTDGTDRATAAATHAIDIASTRSATVQVLSIVDDRAFLVLEDERVEAVREDLRANARDAVETVASEAEANGLTVETIVETGHPAERIVEFAAENGTDLIVMGTSGDEYERNVVGSVSQRVVREASVPVLTVGPTVDD
ncbi:universal stress protein [Natronolimnohabitans innermongolicus]|uniref:UspA domain-containing protein n=1 Tax=Natronolimnohabitans innermongolicus JCM 12255 TaxID=1227499 RepID=L9X8R0_9EURY|nr:universal stress protein [Natronolimnohabitans innermongolicus]ELY56998.1 UspA domain-containing protein [Natronolimnohabitans innermongolicus JCM 12255]